MPNEAERNEAWRTVRAQLMDAIDIVELAKDLGLPLRASGATWSCCCPFHGDRTPSFHVYPAPDPHYHCFGCRDPDGKPQTAIRLYERIKGIRHADAVRQLAADYGIDTTALDGRGQPTPRRMHASPAEIERHAARSLGVPTAAPIREPVDPPRSLRQQACEALLGALQEAPRAGQPQQRARAYLAGRGIPWSAASAYQMSYLDGLDAAWVAQRLHAVAPEAARACGLIHTMDDGRIGLWAYADSLVLFGRSADGGLLYPLPRLAGTPSNPKYPKYKNATGVTPQLFGMREAAIGTGPLHVVEGALDAIAAHAMGLRAVAWLSKPRNDPRLPMLVAYCAACGITQVRVVPDLDATSAKRADNETQAAAVCMELGRHGITASIKRLPSVFRESHPGWVMPPGAKDMNDVLAKGPPT